MTNRMKELLMKNYFKRRETIETAAQWQWGDAENAMKVWAVQIADRLSSWTAGTAKPS